MSSFIIWMQKITNTISGYKILPTAVTLRHGIMSFPQIFLFHKTSYFFPLFCHMTNISQDHEDCTSSIIIYIPFFKSYHRMNNWFPFLFSLSTGRNQEISVITSCQHLSWALNPVMLNQHRLNACQLADQRERKSS